MMCLFIISIYTEKRTGSYRHLVKSLSFFWPKCCHLFCKLGMRIPPFPVAQSGPSVCVYSACFSRQCSFSLIRRPTLLLVNVEKQPSLGGGGGRDSNPRGSFPLEGPECFDIPPSIFVPPEAESPPFPPPLQLQATFYL